MAEQINLANVFDSALQSVQENRVGLNQLDGLNGNHGDNMVRNLQVVVNSLNANPGTPSQQLRSASRALQKQGFGGTSRYYAKGLNQAAHSFQGKEYLTQSDATTLVESILGAIPSEGRATPGPQPKMSVAPTGSVLDEMLGGIMQGSSVNRRQAQSASSGDLLKGILGGILGGAGTSGSGATPQTPKSGGTNLDDILQDFNKQVGSGRPAQQNQDTGLDDILGGILGGGQQTRPSSSGSAQSDPLQDLIGGILGGGSQPQGQGRSQSSGDTLQDLIGGILGGAMESGNGAGRATPSQSDALQDILGGILGGGGSQSQSGGQQDSGMISKLLPAAMAYMRAKQNGADNKSALLQALMAAMLGGQIDPMQSGSSRSAAGGLIAQSILKALMGAP